MTSERKFGVELELGFDHEEDIYILRDNVRSDWNLVRDGSLTCDNPIEVVSPVLKGTAGIRSLKDVCGLIEDLKGNSSHPSCGMHIHLDGSEFKPKIKRLVLTREEMAKLPKDNIKNKTFVYSKVVRDRIKKQEGKLTKSDYSNIIDWVMGTSGFDEEEFLDRKGGVGDNYLMVYNLKNERTAFYVDRSIYDKAYESLRSRLSNLPMDDYVTATSIKSAFNKSILSLVDTSEEGRYYVTIEEDPNFEALKTLFYFYTAFGDVHQNMVQNSRKEGNMYCISLSDSYDLAEIKKVKNMKELQKLWYRVKSDDELYREVREHYSNSRYHDVNLHSLWYRHGTIEIRSHAGTHSWKKIALWVQLHQAIVDKCVSGELTIDKIDGAVGKGVREKTLYMLELLKLPFPVDKYVRRLVNYFAILKEPI